VGCPTLGQIKELPARAANRRDVQPVSLLHSFMHSIFVGTATDKISLTEQFDT